MKKVWRLWLELNDKDLFKSFRVCKLGTQLGKTHKCPREERKVKGSYSKNHTLENYYHCILSPLGTQRFFQDGYQLDARSLDDECQV